MANIKQIGKIYKIKRLIEKKKYDTMHQIINNKGEIIE